MGITRYHVSIDNGDEYVSRSQYGKYVRYDEAMAMVTALTSQLESVVAENASVKAMNDCLSEELRSYESDGAFDGPKMHLLWWKAQTPATDAFLAEVRASGVEMFAASLKVVGPLEHPYSAVAKEFAAQLRQVGAV